MKTIPIPCLMIAVACAAFVSPLNLSAQVPKTSPPEASPAPSQDVDPFGEGVEASSDGSAEDPFRKAGRRSGLTQPPPSDRVRAPEGERNEVPAQVSVLVEYIQLDHADANRLVREYAGKRDVSLLREELETMIGDGGAELLETSYSLTRSGQRATTASSAEKIYATEYDPPELPQTLTIGKENVNSDGQSAIKTAANPTAFDVRVVGLVVEFDPMIQSEGYSPGGDVIELNIAPERVELLEMESMVPDDSPFEESKTIRMPLFYILQCHTTVTSRSGETLLLAVHKPGKEKDKRILVLLRADIVR